MANIRFKSLELAWAHTPLDIKVENPHILDKFADHVFTKDAMKQYISASVLSQFYDALEENRPLSRDLADSVAIGMKRWAMELGATHYTHWFQPLTGGTAEKHDMFLGCDFKENKWVEEFSGSELYQQEPDASSFPSGGIRNTFEARGYSAWDPTSPAFVVGDTLCIPTIFVAYTGEALDYKTPLLRSLTALDKAATAVCGYFDRNVRHVHSNLGWEQEYFLVDEALYNARPDLVMTGRTLVGHYASKSQQLDDHYFGAIPGRVLAFMTELEIEAQKLGIPVKTRHNEVAPGQFELAPIFEECNLANDHNLLLMSLMERLAHKHHFRVLLHEKPFAGVNGSGKHCNWSMSTNTGVNLLAPGKNPYANLQFVTFLVNVMMAVQKHNGLLKASIISATNAHRLGANEAPPAIISIFLGSQITNALNEIENASADTAIVMNAKKEMKLGVGTIPEILVDNTDRNRTSPFAFTGNRFEFRAVGSSANCAAAMLALNACVAEQLLLFKEEVDTLLEKGEAKERALFSVIKSYLKACKPIRFDGNGYSDNWKDEALKRGLDCETSVPLIIDRYLEPGSVRMFQHSQVLSEAELRSRCEVKWETYCAKLQIESRTLTDLVLSHVLPAAKHYRTILDKEYDADEIKKMNEHITEVKTLVDQMDDLRHKANRTIDVRERALLYQDKIVPLMESIRKHADSLELLTDDESWTLPKYRELLFIH